MLSLHFRFEKHSTTQSFRYEKISFRQKMRLADYCVSLNWIKANISRQMRFFWLHFFYFKRITTALSWMYVGKMSIRMRFHFTSDFLYEILVSQSLLKQVLTLDLAKKNFCIHYGPSKYTKHTIIAFTDDRLRLTKVYVHLGALGQNLVALKLRSTNGTFLHFGVMAH